MKKIIVTSIVVLMLMGLSFTFADKPVNEEDVYNGNGAPSGAHFTLNIIGVPHEKVADMKHLEKGAGSVIFVELGSSGDVKRTVIDLTEGDFAVLDKNGTDADGALFQLPNPDPDCDGETWYSVFARPLGTPGGKSTMQSGAYLYVGPGPDGLVGTADDEYVLVLSQEVRVFERNNGKSVFENVSRELLYVYADIGNGLKRYPLFDDRLQDYFWYYDNEGLKVLQLRFYEIPTEVPGVDPLPS